LQGREVGRIRVLSNPENLRWGTEGEHRGEFSFIPQMMSSAETKRRKKAHFLTPVSPH
jgi:hypothetical protein